MAIKPTKCIPVADARKLQDNWVTTRAVDIERSQGFLDTREFVFSLTELSQFLAFVKEQSDQQGIMAPGIRIYFGAYDSHVNDKATVFMTATKGTSSDSDNNYSIDPLNTVQGGWPPKSY